MFSLILIHRVCNVTITPICPVYQLYLRGRRNFLTHRNNHVTSLWQGKSRIVISVFRNIFHFILQHSDYVVVTVVWDTLAWVFFSWFPQITFMNVTEVKPKREFLFYCVSYIICVSAPSALPVCYDSPPIHQCPAENTFIHLSGVMDLVDLQFDSGLMLDDFSLGFV